jgi:CheY-like chemotaxis protein
VPEPAARPNILVVEVDGLFRGALADALDYAGYDTATAINSREAVRVLTSLERPALILLDLDAPASDGYALLARLRSDPTFSPVPVVVMVGEPGPVPAGAVAALRKPVLYGELVRAAAAYCRNGVEASTA